MALGPLKNTLLLMVALWINTLHFVHGYETIRCLSVGESEDPLVKWIKLFCIKTRAVNAQVESYSTERALRKIKRHTPATAAIDIPDPGHGKVNDFSMQTMDIQRVKSEDCCVSHSDDMDVETQSSKPDGNNRGVGKYQKFSGRPSSW